MLTVILRDDNGLTLISDDRNAENVRVEDAFAGGYDDWESDGLPNVDFEVLEAWQSAPFENGKLEVAFGPDHTKEIVDALEAEGFMLDDELLDKIYPPSLGGGPKKL